MANPFLHTARLTPRDVAKKIQTTLTLHDIAPRYRVAWLKSAEARFRHLNFSKAFKSAIQKIQRQSKQPRYPIFFDVKPLVQWAFGPLGPADRGVRLDRLLLQLRLTTLMRSVDVANITWGIFCQGSDFFIQTTTKTGALATFSVAGMTLQTLLEYVWLHLDFPAPYLIRYVHEPHKCMGSERIAKRVKERMQELGIPTEAFKAHSLRGATATTLLMHGMEPQWVQARGGWTNQTTMQVYYSRLHQVQDWERALQGKIDASNLCVRSVVPVTKLPLTEADEGRRRGGSEEQGTTLLTQAVHAAVFWARAPVRRACRPTHASVQRSRLMERDMPCRSLPLTMLWTFQGLHTPITSMIRLFACRFRSSLSSWHRKHSGEG